MDRSDLLAALAAFPYDKKEYWLITGAAMVFYGMKEETADVDLGCSAALADRLEKDGFLYRRTDDGMRWFKLGEDVELFEGWMEEAAVTVEGVRVVSVEGLLEMKRKLGREKDLRDIERVERWLADRAAAAGRGDAPEEMGAFFDRRLDGYEAHQLSEIESAAAFYAFTAELLPKESGVRILDLGCGTGLELDAYFRLNPDAKVTGVDLAPGMLHALGEKHPDKALTLIRGSYFDVPLGEDAFDAAVSVESLHHYSAEEKIPLYARLLRALRRGGNFILTDYFALSEEEEQRRRAELLRLKREAGAAADVIWHFDTPLTVEHEVGALFAAGFSAVQVLNHWGATFTLRAEK